MSQLGESAHLNTRVRRRVNGLRSAQKGKPIPAGMINALLRIDPKATVCSVESFLA